MAEDLAKLAREARLQAYAPYSGFSVGAALQADDGRVFVGCNVENASYGLTICAERSALAAAVAAGARTFARLVVASDCSPPATPCGACCQMLAEFTPGLKVECVGDDSSDSYLLSDLLPRAFTRHQLERGNEA